MNFVVTVYKLFFFTKMASVVYFRMQHGKQSEPVSFSGHQIKLIDLKRAILEKKEMKTGFDFDLKISDADNSSKSKEISLKSREYMFTEVIEYVFTFLCSL